MFKDLALAAATVFSLSAIAPAAHAQSAEQTVAYLLFGMDDGILQKRGKTTISIVEESDSPATYRYSIEERGVIKGEIWARIQSIDACHFQIESRFKLSGPQPVDQSPIFKVDMTKSFKLGADNIVEWQLGGVCPVEGGVEKCGLNRIDMQFLIDRDRWNKAMQYMRSEYCKGQAF